MVASLHEVSAVHHPHHQLMKLPPHGRSSNSINRQKSNLGKGGESDRLKSEKRAQKIGDQDLDVATILRKIPILSELSKHQLENLGEWAPSAVIDL
jgi:hypothetical protein